MKGQGETAAEVGFVVGEETEAECAGYVDYDAGGAVEFEEGAGIVC